MPRIKGAPSRAELAFLSSLARAGGFVADCTHGLERIAASCERRNWLTLVGRSSAALTWSGWQVVPRMFDADAAAACGMRPATWTDYAGRGMVPVPDGYCPNPATGRVVRFWWPWTVEAWQAATPRANPGARPGTRRCMVREPGTTGRAGLCRAAISPDNTCTRGHTEQDRAVA